MTGPHALLVLTQALVIGVFAFVACPGLGVVAKLWVPTLACEAERAGFPVVFGRVIGLGIGAARSAFVSRRKGLLEPPREGTTMLPQLFFAMCQAFTSGATAVVAFTFLGSLAVYSLLLGGFSSTPLVLCLVPGFLGAIALLDVTAHSSFLSHPNAVVANKKPNGDA